ncbi:DarT ssDNA thymidine ADP-ribosyltransferase family protein [Exiguobacterium sp. R-17]|uniref:DarT ssDNA thymidine ADP-ribosyltransferase family protein n=1 Tax=Exiguobacterium sp. R-17 TaxID=3404054 RepID=UPI003CF7D5B5
MGYKEILRSQLVRNHIATRRHWWSEYIYHFSHVTNIASILNEGKIKSRAEIMRKLPIGYNDNASSEVIDGTSFDVHEYVRFYFRPLTPTQYRNEGVKSNFEVDQFNAHCPVPVFLLFDTDILEDERTMFSYESLASRHHVERYNNIYDFIRAPFRDIYHTGPISREDNSSIIKKRRHAEVLIKDSYDLSLLRLIICRTEAEQETLFNLIDENAKRLYRDKIVLLKNDYCRDMFYYDKLMINKVTKIDDQIIIYFNKCDTLLRNISIKWTNLQGIILTYWTSLDTNLSEFMQEGNKIVFNIPELSSETFFKLTVTIDENLVYQKDYYK